MDSGNLQDSARTWRNQTSITIQHFKTQQQLPVTVIMATIQQQENKTTAGAASVHDDSLNLINVQYLIFSNVSTQNDEPILFGIEDTVGLDPITGHENTREDVNSIQPMESGPSHQPDDLCEEDRCMASDDAKLNTSSSRQLGPSTTSHSLDPNGSQGLSILPIPNPRYMNQNQTLGQISLQDSKCSRQRARTSCMICVARRVKCEGGFPCNSCKFHKIEKYCELCPMGGKAEAQRLYDYLQKQHCSRSSCCNKMRFHGGKCKKK
eukprot:jgi/Bigna1/77897/fgenesh1_pg.51_\